MDNNVYTGLWTNWSRGAILGATLTTTKQYGNLMIAFIALFVGFVASRLWRISCLILHRCYSTTADRNAIHHQRQIILRNSQTPESGFIDILFLLWAWRKSQARHFAGLLLLVLFSVCYLAVIAAAGGFSSSVSSSIGDEVLINGQNCGVLVPNRTVEGAIMYTKSTLEQANSAANYVQQCYRTNVSKTTTACNKFVRSDLPNYSMNNTAGCPFQDQICRNAQSAIRLDSGYIDSHDDLGLNAPRGQRFAYRHVLHCAALQTNDYTSHVEEGGRGWDRYHYGTAPVGPFDNRTGFLNYTYQVEDLDAQYTMPQGSALSGINFKLSYRTFMSFQGEFVSWSPIPELVRPDGDLTVIFLSGAGKIRSSAYTSFSCFGLYFTFITGALVTITSYVLEPILNKLRKHRQYKPYAHLEWVSNNSLQLHRMAHEELMGKTWADCTGDIPTTDPEAALANLDISDPEHPILHRPVTSKATTQVVEAAAVPDGSSSPLDGGSVHSYGADNLSGPTATSSRTSVSDYPWTLDVRMTLMNVSGQLSLEKSEQEESREEGR